MSFAHQSTRPYHELDGVGIAIRDFDGQKHVGVLYSTDDGVINLCHLAWHQILLNRPIDDGYHWKSCRRFETEEDVLIARGRLISISESTVMPYGFANEPDCFNSDFDIPIRPIGWGLTCASFVLAVFEFLGYQLVEYSTWVHRPSDVAWQKAIAEKVRERDPAQAAALETYIGSVRYRPQEVAAVATSKSGPVTFYYATSRSTEVDENLCPSILDSMDESSQTAESM